MIDPTLSALAALMAKNVSVAEAVESSPGSVAGEFGLSQQQRDVLDALAEARALCRLLRNDRRPAEER